MAVYVVNPGGAVHSIEDAEAPRVLGQPGFREASVDEVADWYAAQGLEAPSTEAPSPRGRKAA